MLHTSDNGVGDDFRMVDATPKILPTNLRTARGLGLGFDDLSRKCSRIPRKVRKKMTVKVVKVMAILPMRMAAL